MQLLINCFPIEIAPEEFSLPSTEAPDWDQSSAVIRQQFGEYTVARSKKDNGTIGIFLVDGPTAPTGTGHSLVGRDVYPHVVSEVALTSLATHFKARRLDVQKDNFELTIATPAAQYVLGEIELRTGIAVRIRIPDTDRRASVRLAMVRWEVKRDFKSNLDSPELARLCVGKPVIYSPKVRPSNNDVPPEFVDRYLGHVTSLDRQSNVTVSCKDRVERTVPAKDLRLEATSATVSEYERQLGDGARGGRSIWHRTQELGFVLTSSGRRNASVLRDRLDAIRRFLGQDTTQAILLPPPRLAPVKLSLGLTPLAAEIITNV